MAHRGPCKGCGCPDIIQPVCGSDNHTYINSCEATCHYAHVEYAGLCTDDCNCPDTNRPVCGSDGVTYRNFCIASCRGVSLTR